MHVSALRQALHLRLDVQYTQYVTLYTCLRSWQVRHQLPASVRLLAQLQALWASAGLQGVCSKLVCREGKQVSEVGHSVTNI